MQEEPKRKDIYRKATKSYKPKNDKKDSIININGTEEETGTTKTSKGKKVRWKEDVEVNIVENWKIYNVVEDEES